MKYARELTTLVAAPLLIWVVGWSHEYVFDVTIGVIGLLAHYEFLTLGEHKGFHVPKTICLAVMLFILGAFVLEPISVEMGVFLALLIIPATYVFGHAELEEALPSSAIAVLSTLYIGMLGGSLIRLRKDFIADGPHLIFFLLIVVWIGDAGAYYIGKTFGKHRLSPRISPKKSVEGMFGGITTSIIASIVIHFTFFPRFPLIHAAIAGAVLSVSGVVGDLAESMWKRSASVKDSGTLIPGHGGFLDRFDSIFFTAPLLYVYWVLIQNGFTSLRIMSV